MNYYIFAISVVPETNKPYYIIELKEMRNTKTTKQLLNSSFGYFVKLSLLETKVYVKECGHKYQGDSNSSNFSHSVTINKAWQQNCASLSYCHDNYEHNWACIKDKQLCRPMHKILLSGGLSYVGGLSKQSKSKICQYWYKVSKEDSQALLKPSAFGLRPSASLSLLLKCGMLQSWSIISQWIFSPIFVSLKNIERWRHVS